MELKLSAIDLKYVDNIPTYKEDKIRSKAYIAYGSDNKWPDYLYGLYKDVSTLNTLINGSADYTAGNGVEEYYIVNTSGVLLSELIRQIAFDRKIVLKNCCAFETWIDRIDRKDSENGRKNNGKGLSCRCRAV